MRSRFPEAANRSESIAVNEVVSVRFDGEPSKLNLVRTMAGNGRYEDALGVLDEIEQGGVDDPRVGVEMEFYRGVCLARLGLGGSGDLKAAGQFVRSFVQKHADNYHYYSAVELLGELYAALGAFPSALAEYEKLEATPWPDYKMRAAIAKGRVYQQQKEFEKALAEFEEVLELAGSSSEPLIDRQRLSARLGKASCLADMERYDDAVEIVEGVVAGADPEQAGLHALAYNTLGHCLKKADRTREALLAYLHVDLLYPTEPAEHAEALRNLAELWAAVDQPERAQQALDILTNRYGGKGGTN